MTFPVYLWLGPVRIHPHLLFETLAYVLGMQLYLRARSHDAVPEQTRFSVLVGAAAGAALGSKLLYWLEWPADTWAHLADPAWLLGGKSIVGGLLGGWLGVELAKRLAGERRSTGDRFVIPLAVAMIIGRLGCFLSGLEDHTAGVASSAPWAIDFGDGVTRHPAQLYEMLALLVFVLLLQIPRRTESGMRFRLFMLLYLSFRFGIEFLKPGPRWLMGLSAIQVASLLGLVYAAAQLFPRQSAEEVHDG